MYDVSENISWKTFEAGVVLLNLTTGNYYTLNQSATLIWQAIMDGKSDAEILSQLLDKYDCEEEKAKRDLTERISFLLTEGLIRESDQQKPAGGQR
jgi:hypothetical protein